MRKIAPVILCGGAGTRLRPLSRAGFLRQGENQSTYIPLGEVQSGNYLGVDDIVRLEDTYGRAKS